MNNLPPQWREFGQNVMLYAFLLIISMGAFSLFRSPMLLATMWGVALLGMLILGYQAIKLAAGSDKNRVQTNAKMKAYCEQAGAYKKKIETLIKKSSSAGGQSVYRERLLAQVDDWTGAVDDLIAQITRFLEDDIINADIKNVPKAITKLEKQLKSESDESVKEQLAHTLENRKKQLAALEALQAVIRRAEIQIESTISMLGTIYSQLLTSQSTDHVADYNRLSEDVDEEVARLHDHLEALREVKLSG